MYYELYVDVLFLVNFMMDYLLLMLVSKMLSCIATHGRIFLGAIVGSLLTCIVVILPIPYPLIKVVLFHMFVNTCMIRVGLKIKTMRAFVKALIMLYIGGFLLGGILEAFRQYVTIGSLFLLVALVGYYLVLGIWKFISHFQKINQCYCSVELHMAKQIYRVKGLIDTGNNLRDPESGKPVHILNRSTARQFFGEKSTSNLRYIPYRTIGKENGVLLAFEIDKMYISGEKECVVERPLIGVCEEKVSAEGEYEMILNPNVY